MKLGLIAPTPGDSTSFYRAFGPFGYLSRECGVELITGEHWGWQHIVPCDMIFLQRPWIDAHRMVAEQCFRLGVPLWIDYDDNLFAVQRSNPAYGTFMNPNAHQNMRRLAELADVITVTTSALTNLFPKEKTHIIPNAFNNYIWPEPPSQPRNKTITWRGGISHFGDMEPFIESFGEVSRQSPGWDWHFIGDPHWSIEHVIAPDQRFIHSFGDILSYMRNFAALRPAIHIVPLAENTFNYCKSNLAWLEASFAGAAVLAPDWVEWRKPGVTLYKDVKDFRAKLQEMVDMKECDRWAMVEASRAHIKENLTLQVVNQQRVDLLNKLYAREPATK